MKKISFLFVLLSVFISSYGEDRLVVDNTQIVSGESAYIVVKMDFAENHDYVSYQFNVELPSGISLIEETSGQACFVLPSNQPTNIFKITDFPMSNGILKVASNPSTVIGAHEGVLVYIPVEAEGGLTSGDILNGKLSNVVFAHENATTEDLADVNFTITIADQVVLDENSEIAPLATSGNVNVKVKRTIKANEWSTLCLPFDMTKEQVLNTFGDDVKLAYFEDYGVEKEGSNVNTITVNFEEEDLSLGFSGNYPYLIKISKDVTEFTVDGVNIDPDEDNAVIEYTNGKNGNKKVVYGTCKGIYQANTTVPENSLFLSGNQFWYSTGKTKMKAFRAYFTLQDILTDKSVGARINITDDETTGIKEVHGNASVEGTYDLQGRKVEEPTNKGLYIVNGKKVVKK
jgi:hypothetical protein